MKYEEDGEMGTSEDAEIRGHGLDPESSLFSRIPPGVYPMNIGTGMTIRNIGAFCSFYAMGFKG
jgi:hypothetical protein